MNKDKYRKILKDYIPEASIEGIVALFEKHPVYFLILFNYGVKNCFNKSIFYRFK